MSNYSAGQGPYPADPHPRLRLAALTAVIAGVVLLAAAAFVLSYPGIHQLALRAGVSPGLAKLYPLIFDAMLVVAGAAALALRGAGWWPRAYAWFSLLLLVTVVAVGDAVRATNVALPIQPTRAVAAVTPWVLLLLAFGLLLEMLRHLRQTRTAGAQRENADRAAAAEPAAAGQAMADGTAEGSTAEGSTANGSTAGGGTIAGSDTAARAPVTWAGAAGAGAGRSLPAPRSGLDLLLGPREIEAPAMADAGAATAGYAGYHDGDQHPDPVAYGPETGYVHPDSYADPVSYPAGPQGTAGPAGNGGPEPGDVPGQPGSPTKAQEAAGPRKQAAPETGPKASGPGTAAAAAAAATAAAAPGGAPPAGPDAPPAPETPAEAAAQNGPAAATAPAATAENPAGKAGSPGPADDTPAEKPAPAPMLERLRSTPAPPEE